MTNDLKEILESVVLAAKSMSKEEIKHRLSNTSNNIFKDVLAMGSIDLFWEALFDFKHSYNIVSESFSENLYSTAFDYFDVQMQEYFNYNSTECPRGTLPFLHRHNSNLSIAA